MRQTMCARLSVTFLLAVPLCLTACTTYSSAKLKEQTAECRQAAKTPLSVPPQDFMALPAYLVEVLAVVEAERALDRIEWECIEGL